MNKFVEDMEAAGYQVEAYHGRAYWTGPAVRFHGIAELQDIIRATDVRVQWDSPMLYPVFDDPEWYEANKDDIILDEDVD